MGMMAKMRNLAPAFIITVGGLFVLYMVISDSNVQEFIGARSNNVGSVNGRDITYQEFNSFVDRAIENQKAQTGQDIPEEQMDQFRDQVWDAMVTQILTEEQLEKFGIEISADEIREVILGENPPEFLKRNFIDSLGRFNREMYESALFDARNKEALLQAEEAVKQQLLSQKLQNMLFASISVSEGELKRKFVDQTVKMNAEFVLVDINNIPDNQVTVSDADLKKYYDENPDQFSIKDQRKIKFVTFQIVPSRKDSDMVFQTLRTVVETAKNDTADFKFFVDSYSETPYSRDTNSINQLPGSLADIIGTLQPGAIVGPLGTGTGYGVYKYLGTTSGTETIAKASHILVSSTGDDAKDLEEANKIYNQLTGGADFSALAKQLSKDPGSAQKGGDLGWFGKGQMVKEFEDACFNGPVNQVQKPIKTSYGYHIIKVTGRSNTKYITEKITGNIKPSGLTREEIYNQAKDFVYLAEKNNFEKEAELLKLPVQESQPFEEDAQVIPGVGYNKGIVKYTFENGLNTISPVFKTQGGYIVFKVSDITKAGVKQFDKIKEEIKTLVIREKKFEKALSIANNIVSKTNGNLSIASQVYAQARFDTTGEFTPAGSIPKVGVEYNVANVAYKAPLNKVTGPVKGQRGYYIIKVLNRTNFDQNSYTMQRNSLRDNLLQEKKSSYINVWLESLKKNAEIEDNRYLFYGM